MPPKRNLIGAKPGSALVSSSTNIDEIDSTENAGGAKKTAPQKTYNKKDWSAVNGGVLRRGRSKASLQSEESKKGAQPAAGKKDKKVARTNRRSKSAGKQPGDTKGAASEKSANGKHDSADSSSGNSSNEDGQDANEFGPHSPKTTPPGGRKSAKSTSSDQDEPKAKKGRETAPLLNKTESDLRSLVLNSKKKNELNKAANMKILSWNVGGIRAMHKKDGLAYIMHEDADIVCLQEVRAADADIPHEIESSPGYKKFWLDSKRKKGYAGCAIWSKTEPINVTYGIGSPSHDEEGRAITAEFEEFYVVNTYVPNAGRKLVTLPVRLEWNKLFATYIQKLDAVKPVIIAGDMNVAHNEIDLANPKTNTKNAGFTKEERKGMTDFLGGGFVDTFRHFYPDAVGQYTFWSYMGKARANNVGWRLDYFIASERYVANICDNVIRNEVFGSDHCPIVLFLGA